MRALLQKSKTHSFNLYHFGIGFTQRKLVASHGYFDRITERSDLSYVKLNASRYSHIHYSALYSALAVKLNYSRSTSDLYALQSFHLIAPRDLMAVSIR